MAMIRPRPRSPQAIVADIYTQQRVVNYIASLAADYLNIYTPPILVRPDGIIEPYGPLPIPDVVRDHLAAERATLAMLELELHDYYHSPVTMS